jgi:adenylate cyclase, class 2
MPQETEIKLKIRDVKAFQRVLKRLGAKPVGSISGRVHELNVIFDTPDGGLAKHGQLLRLRTEAPAPPETKTSKGKKSKATQAKPTRQILTFKRPTPEQLAAPATHRFSGPHKIREEIEAQVSDSENLTKIFEGLGMRGWFRYEKFRTTYQLPTAKHAWARGLLIELDETPIGTYVELEGPAAAIDRAATELGYFKSDYVLTNYLKLYAEDCRRKGQQPQHMLFTK